MTKNVLITETQTQALQKATKAPNGIRLQGIFGQTEVVNSNQRKYNTANYRAKVEALQEVIKNGALLGELEHPPTRNINNNNVSHKIESIYFNEEDNTIRGTILLLNTAKGKDLQAIVEAGCPLYISSRGYGNQDENGNVMLEELITYDVVGTPGFSNAVLNKFQESLGGGVYVLDLDLLENNSPKVENKMQNAQNPEQLVEFISAYLENRLNGIKPEKLNDSTIYSNIDSYLAQEFIPALEAKLDNKISKNNVAVDKWIREEVFSTITDYIKTEAFGQIDKWMKQEVFSTITDYIKTEAFGEIDKWMKKEVFETITNYIKEEAFGTITNYIKEETIPEVLKTIDEYNASGQSVHTELDIIEKLVAAEKSNPNGNVVLKNMPQEFQYLWETCSNKKEILAESVSYEFATPKDYEFFWRTRQFETKNTLSSIAQRAKLLR